MMSSSSDLQELYSQGPSGLVHKVAFLGFAPAGKERVTDCHKETWKGWSPSFTEVPGWAKRCKVCFRGK